MQTTLCTLISPFSLRSAAFTEPKTFFKSFKVSLNMMCGSDLDLEDVEKPKLTSTSTYQVHWSGPEPNRRVLSVFQQAIAFSALIIIIVLFDRVLGLLFCLAGRNFLEHVVVPNLSTGDQARRMARGFFGFSLDNVLTSFTDVFILNFSFISWPLRASRDFCLFSSHGRRNIPRARSSTISRVFIKRVVVDSLLIMLIVLFD